MPQPPTLAAGQSHGGTTLFARYGGNSIGWVLVREDGTTLGCGAVATLPELATISYAAGAVRTVLKCLIGSLPKPVLTFASEHGWELDIA